MKPFNEKNQHKISFSCFFYTQSPRFCSYPYFSNHHLFVHQMCFVYTSFVDEVFRIFFKYTKHIHILRK